LLSHQFAGIRDSRPFCAANTNPWLASGRSARRKTLAGTASFQFHFHSRRRAQIVEPSVFNVRFTVRFHAGTRPAPPSANGTVISAQSYLCDQLTDNPQEQTMDWNRIEGNWKIAKGKVKEKWGQLTDDDLNQVAGKRDQLEGKIQERYGLAKDLVRKNVDDWLKQQP
jgi:uncharacterized protein YjbJ (UPF0337 family)